MPALLDPAPPLRPPCLFALEHIEAFHEVARHASLTKLLHRSTRAVSLTAAGRLMLRRSQAVIEPTARIHSELRAHAAA